MEPRNLAILGSTGSIGRQTLDIVADYPQKYRAYLITAGKNADLLIEQAKQFKPAYAIIADDSLYGTVKDALSGYPTEVLAGHEAIEQAMAIPEIDTVVTAMVGYSGLAPTIKAIRHGKKIALANKETLVVAGELIYSLLQQSESVLYPVDSEHGAIFQCLKGEKHEQVAKLILTASGGPFRTKSVDELKHVTIDDALNHPNWSMGKKITVDSATMMNKGFEVMEARWLFDMKPEQIEVVVHPQSIVHSMIEFVDGSVKAQLGLPDMHIPIQYALSYPERLPSARPAMKLIDYANLTFEAPDLNKFPLLAFAYEAMQRGGNIPCALNAANEIAVDAFLRGAISYNQIYQLILNAVTHTDFDSTPSYETYVQTNLEVRQRTSELLTSINF